MVAVTTVTAVTTGATSAVGLGNLGNSAGVGLILNVPAGVTFVGGIQVSGSMTGPWNSHDQMGNMTGSGNGSIAFPVLAVRLNITTLVGLGSGQVITLFVCEPGV